MVGPVGYNRFAKGHTISCGHADVRGSHTVYYYITLSEVHEKILLRCFRMPGDVWCKVKKARKFFAKNFVHLHVPAGATPKDGPSAGITLALSLCSSLTGRKVDVSYAMTGEMTLHGDVLPIGGVREKILAAKRLGIKKLILPEDNKSDVDELGEWIKSGMRINYVSKMSSVFQLALK